MTGGSQENNELSALMREILNAPMRQSPENAEDVCSAAGLKTTGGALLSGALWLKGYRGDVSAAKLIREITGGAEQEGVCGDLSRLSEAELWQIVHREAAAPDAPGPEET